jgi:uncharacterized protein with PIN domain
MAKKMLLKSSSLLHNTGNLNTVTRTYCFKGDLIMQVNTKITADSEIKNIKIDDELRVCPACGYEYGFHTSFLKVNAGKDSPVKSTREVYQVILICPECGARYDVGWRVSFAEPGNRVVRTTGNQVAIL